MPIVITNPVIPGLVYWDSAKSSADWTISGTFATTQPSGNTLQTSVRSLVGVSSGKHYVELDMRGNGAGGYTFGVSTEFAPTLPGTAHWYYRENAFRWVKEGIFVDTLTNLITVTPKVYGLAIDMDSKVLSIYDGSGIRVGEANAISQFPITGDTTTLTEAFINIGSEGALQWGSVTANFGQNAFSYPVPGGFNPGWPGYF